MVTFFLKAELTENGTVRCKICGSEVKVTELDSPREGCHLKTLLLTCPSPGCNWAAVIPGVDMEQRRETEEEKNGV